MTSIGFISEVCEDERKMFDSLLELDFLTLSNQNKFGLNEAAAINEATEEKVKFNIVDRAKQIIDKFAEILTNAWEKFKEKVNEFMKGTDKKLVNKYKETLQKNWDTHKKDFKGLKNFDVINFDKLKKIEDDITGYEIVLYGSNMGKSSSVVDWAKANFDDVYKTEEKFIPTRDYLVKSANDLVNSDNIIVKVKKSVGSAINSMKKKLDRIKKDQKEATDETKVADLKKEYEELTASIKAATAEFNTAISLNNLRLRSDRRVVFTCGSFTNKMENAAKHESASESEIDKLDDEIEVEEAYSFANMVGLASDTFCENVFANDEY